MTLLGKHVPMQGEWADGGCENETRGPPRWFQNGPDNTVSSSGNLTSSLAGEHAVYSTRLTGVSCESSSPWPAKTGSGTSLSSDPLPTWHHVAGIFFFFLLFS
ncbi:hypothetical protein IF1G_04332 [Cordyceps javanica]|uniref:Uncharacterized protein n=1 Tax=Cordyceps javanica TaxID=43265 RepID=A0A545V5U7_9HYPO|nr:hypothetical protein IF1G_04332 [Cordyceps javanica]